MDDPGRGQGRVDPGEAGRRVVQARGEDVVGVTHLGSSCKPKALWRLAVLPLPFRGAGAVAGGQLSY